MNHKAILEEISRQTLIALGALAPVQGADDDDKVLINAAKTRLTGIVHGINNILIHIPEEETLQFDRAQAIESKPIPLSNIAKERMQ